jgi:hypothetical protein
MGVFSPIGLGLLLAGFANYKSNPKIWAAVFHGKIHVGIMSDKNGFGYTLGDFSQTHLKPIILRHRNLQLQRQRCNRQERF